MSTTFRKLAIGDKVKVGHHRVSAQLKVRPAKPYSYPGVVIEICRRSVLIEVAGLPIPFSRANGTQWNGGGTSVLFIDPLYADTPKPALSALLSNPREPSA